MELRHLRYFVAVAEEGSLTVAAAKRLHTSQPSLSRQLRDLEEEVGAQLFERGARGVALTASGRAFLEHARLALSHAREAAEVARRAARPQRHPFSVCFLSGQEVDWLPRVTQILRNDLPNIDFRVSSLHSPAVADAVQRGEVDLGFSRLERRSGVTYQVIAREPIVAILPSQHPLARSAEIEPKQIEGEVFIGYTEIPHVLRDIVARYFDDHGVQVTPTQYLDNLATGISLVASTGGLTLLPAYAEPLLPRSVVSRPLSGDTPTIELAVGYRQDNPSPVLQTFLAGLGQLIAAGPAGTREASRPPPSGDVEQVVAERVVSSRGRRGRPR
jgi:LysR family transcriptional regulator, hca operon transcriptional activator